MLYRMQCNIVLVVPCGDIAVTSSDTNTAVVEIVESD